LSMCGATLWHPSNPRNPSSPAASAASSPCFAALQCVHVCLSMVCSAHMWCACC
jgi:hypothetical protein